MSSQLLLENLDELIKNEQKLNGEKLESVAAILKQDPRLLDAVVAFLIKKRAPAQTPVQAQPSPVITTAALPSPALPVVQQAVVSQTSAPITQTSAPITQPSAQVTQPSAQVTQQTPVVQTPAVTQPSAQVTQPSAQVTQTSAPVSQTSAPVSQQAPEMATAKKFIGDNEFLFAPDIKVPNRVVKFEGDHFTGKLGSNIDSLCRNAGPEETCLYDHIARGKDGYPLIPQIQNFTSDAKLHSDPKYTTCMLNSVHYIVDARRARLGVVTKSAYVTRYALIKKELNRDPSFRNLDVYTQTKRIHQVMLARILEKEPDGHYRIWEKYVYPVLSIEIPGRR